MGLKDKASKINFSTLPAVAPVPTGTEVEGESRRPPRTAPGQMMEFAQGQRSELLRENDALREKAGKVDELRGRLDEALTDLQIWDGAKATRLLDPALIRNSRFANRDSRSFATAAFDELKAEIASAGGNVQPVKVRPGADIGYEIVYGHRRVEACRQLGLQVLSLVDNIDDRALFVEMDRENRGRKDLSPWEQGVMYQRALTDGLFSSNRKLAEAVGADLSAVGKALSLASLPQEVVDAFPSPLEIQFRWAKPLREALEAEPAGVIERANALKAASTKLAAKDVFERLIAPIQQGVEPFHPPASSDLMVGDKRVGRFVFSRKGALTIHLDAGAVPEKRAAALAKALESFIKSK